MEWGEGPRYSLGQALNLTTAGRLHHDCARPLTTHATDPATPLVGYVTSHPLQPCLSYHQLSHVTVTPCPVAPRLVAVVCELSWCWVQLTSPEGGQLLWSPGFSPGPQEAVSLGLYPL